MSSNHSSGGEHGSLETIGEQKQREENAYVGVCTDCGLEDSLPVSNAETMPDVGETASEFVCDCGNTTWEVTGYDRLVFQRESRYEQGPDISGSYHSYARIEWQAKDGDEYPRPTCPVRQLGCANERHECWRTASRVTTDDGRGAWSCPWHGTFRVFDYPREEPRETTQETLIADGGCYRPPSDAVAHMSPTANWEGFERRCCPNCRLYFDAAEDSADVFCSTACEHRHERGELKADGGEPVADTERTYCAHCGKLLNDAEYATEHLASVHDVDLEDARSDAESVDWSDSQ